MKGFKLLEATCKDLTCKLADSEEKARSKEEDYAALEEKARSDEASSKELISRMEDQIRSHEAHIAEIVSQARARIQADAEAYTTEVSWMNKVIQTGEVAYFELAEKMKECESALKDRESVRFTSCVGTPLTSQDNV